MCGGILCCVHVCAVKWKPRKAVHPAVTSIGTYLVIIEETNVFEFCLCLTNGWCQDRLQVPIPSPWGTIQPHLQGTSHPPSGAQLLSAQVVLGWCDTLTICRLLLILFFECVCMCVVKCNGTHVLHLHFVNPNTIPSTLHSPIRFSTCKQ